MLKLSDEVRARILALRHSAGYEDLLDIGEKLCQMEETELLKMDRSKGITAEQILSKQDQCRGFRLFFESLQMAVEAEANALLESQKAKATPVPQPDFSGLAAAAEAEDMLGMIPAPEGFD